VYTTLSIIDIILKEGFERTWRLTKRAYNVHGKVTAPIYDAMLRILESGDHLNLSEYVGDLILKDIEERDIELAPMEEFGGVDVGDIIRDPKRFDAGIVSTRVSMSMMKIINGVLDSGLYLNVSDYLRYTIKKDLESRNIDPILMKADTEEVEEPAKSWRPSDTVNVSTMVPMAMLENIERILSSGFYLRVSDYLIGLIRKDLEARGMDLSSTKSNRVS